MILVTLGAGLACDSNKGGGPTTPPPPAPLPATISLQPVVGGFDSPVGMAQPPNDNRMFVVQKSGEIKVVKNGSTLATPFLDISGLLSTSYERGLLSMAFRPDYATSGRFYVCYTGADGDVTVARYHVSTGNPDVAAPTADEIVLRIEHSISDSHNGGLILFGPDGKMYVGVGDGHTGVNTGQDPSDMLGNILRIDVSGTSGYTNPSDNPYPGSPVWSWGLRNPWRFTFDRTTGDLYIADVGEIDREEVSVATAASGRGKDVNFGWSVYEGTLCRFGNCSPAGKTMPVIEYPHAPQSEPFCIIGGAVYRGTAISGLQGHYFYGDAFGTWLRSFKYSGGAATEQTLWNVTLPAPPLAFAEDHQGQIYILTEAGDILRIAP
jgi:glucose/arabinose dehydrogenase